MKSSSILKSVSGLACLALGVAQVMAGSVVSGGTVLGAVWAKVRPVSARLAAARGRRVVMRGMAGSLSVSLASRW